MDDRPRWEPSDAVRWEALREKYWEEAGRDPKEEDMARVARLEVERWLLEGVRMGEYEFSGVDADGEITYRERAQ